MDQPKKFSKKSSKALGLWVKTCRKMGYNQIVVQPDGKKKLVNVVKKGTPQYDEVKAEFSRIKSLGY